MGSWNTCNFLFPSDGDLDIFFIPSSQPNSLCFRPGHDAMVARLVTGLAAQTLHTGELRFQRHGTQRHLQLGVAWKAWWRTWKKICQKWRTYLTSQANK